MVEAVRSAVAPLVEQGHDVLDRGPRCGVRSDRGGGADGDVAVGAVVPWAQAGVGAVATQAIGEPAYGPRCLDLMAGGESAPAALDAAEALDAMSPLRQVGVVGADGSAAAFTGELCIDHCGHLLGDGWAVQANMMANEEVWPAMAAAFEGSRQSSLTRPAACRAACGAGCRRRRPRSDVGGADRGRRLRPDDRWAGRLVDLRVDRHQRPLEELDRLVDAADAYAGFQRGVDALMAGDASSALEALDAGLALLPGEENLMFPRTGALMLAGRQIEGLAEARASLAARPSWSIVLHSFAQKGLITLPPDLEP